MNGMSAQEFAEAVQSLIQRDKQSNAEASQRPGRSSLDTTVDQAEDVPGKDFAAASFANVSYLPAPISQLYRKTDAAGNTTYINILSARVVGWTNGLGSSYSEDRVPNAQGTNAFTSVFTGWSSGYV